MRLVVQLTESAKSTAVDREKRKPSFFSPNTFLSSETVSTAALQMKHDLELEA